VVLTLAKLELLDIDQMTRHQLVDAALTSREHLPDDLVARVEQMPVDQLRLLVLTARLVCVLRLLQTPIQNQESASSLSFLDRGEG
jgi:hypothetical protein